MSDDRPGYGEADTLLWVDVEATGLDPEVDCLLEIGLMTTEQAPGFAILDSTSVLVRPTERYLETFADEDVFDAHLGPDGLWDQAMGGRPLDEALLFLRGWLDGALDMNESPVARQWSRRGPMCGSSVHYDRRMLEAALLPMGDTFVEDYWTYRNLDVSTLKELAIELEGEDPIRRLFEWAKVPADPPHRALDDLAGSIQVASLLAQRFDPTEPKETSE